MASDETDDKALPLLSNAFLLKLTALIGLLAVLTAVLTVAGKYYGDRLAMDDYTESRQLIRIVVGQDVLVLPANMIRFQSQRHDGQADAVSVYLSWPEMDGYTASTNSRFSDPSGSQDLIFIEFSQSVMSRDMSGRLGPIYSRLFTGDPEAGPAGLILHHLDPKSGFSNEAVLTGMTKAGEAYVVRCLVPSTDSKPTTADCQRDIHVGHDLTLLYRFSSTLLPDWEVLDSKMQAFAQQHIQN